VKRIAGYSLVFIVAFIASLIVYLPAGVVISRLTLPSQLLLNGVEGTVWQGSIKQVRWQNDDFGELQWRVKPSALLSAKLEASVRFGRESDLNLRGKGEVGYGLEGAYASNLVLSMPVDEVLKRAPMPVPFVAKGQLELTVQNYTYQSPYCLNAKGTLAWSQAGVESPFGNLDLAQTIADVTCENSTLNVKGSQNSTQVSSEYSAQLSPNYRYQANGWFKPRTDFPKSLADKLKWLPRPDSQGRYQFKQQGRL